MGIKYQPSFMRGERGREMNLLANVIYQVGGRALGLLTPILVPYLLERVYGVHMKNREGSG